MCFKRKHLWQVAMCLPIALATRVFILMHHLKPMFHGQVTSPWDCLVVGLLLLCLSISQSTGIYIAPFQDLYSEARYVQHMNVAIYVAPFVEHCYVCIQVVDRRQLSIDDCHKWVVIDELEPCFLYLSSVIYLFNLCLFYLLGIFWWFAASDIWRWHFLSIQSWLSEQVNDQVTESGQRSLSQ